ncbi:helix-turn-helix domain-containing protein [Nonomuraea sp. NPDC049309]|uniref:AlbA family DNA-binding domain-containing protein n=1 Tax=Nonomuraea sp. NPDC049309 TaxID=3364350 RepID=UPI0037212EC6
MFRSARLEALFGKRFDQVVFADVIALIGREEAAEAADLDYKERVHAKNDEQKVEFCKDVVAMANDRGGLLVIGMKEDGQRALPQEVTKVEVSDGELRRLYDVLLNVSPHPLRVDILAVEDPDDPGHGVLLVLVERSGLAPHALLDTRDKTHHRDGWLRFPIRNGAATRWMLEPEVATRYRDRFITGRSVHDRLNAVEIECVEAYAERDGSTLPDPPQEPHHGLGPRTPEYGFYRKEPARPNLVVTVVPETAGRLVINQAALQELRRAQAAEPVLIGLDRTFQQVGVAPGRLTAILGDPIIAVYSELHTDGSGSFLISLLREDQTGETIQVLVQELVWYLLSGLRHLGRHARDRTAAGGVTAIRLSLLADTDEVGDSGIDLPRRDPLREIQLTSNTSYGDYARLSPTHRAVGDVFAPLDDLATDGPGLISAAALVANEACHAFGLAEVPLLDTNGTINRHHWDGPLQAIITNWASW